MMKNKSFFSRLLENKKLMLITSFVLAFVFWIISSDNITVTIDDIPLKTNLSISAENEGMTVYSVSPETISVSVSGKRLIVDSLDADDFTATVDLFDVTKPGTETYEVDIDTKSNMNFDINGTNPMRVTVMVDYEETKEVPVYSLISDDVDGSYYIDSDLPEKIGVKGPKSIVDQIKSAYVKDTISASNGADVTKTLTVHLCDKADPNNADAKEVYSEFVKVSGLEKFENVTFRFLKTKEISVALKYDQKQVVLDDSMYTITPSKIKVAGKATDISVDKIYLDLGSLSQYMTEDTKLKTFDIESVLGDNLVCVDGTKSITFELDLDRVDTKTVAVENIDSTSVPTGYKFNAPSVVDPVVVVGDADEVSRVTPANLTYVYDFSKSKVNEDGSVNVTVSCNINGYNSCWVKDYPKEKTVTLTKN